MKTCAVDFETGGLVAGFHPALSVAIVPLGDDFMPDESIEPFISDIGVDIIERVDPGALKVNGKTLDQVRAAGDRKDSVRAFFAWAKEVGKFAPLAQNWTFDKGFFQYWIDPEFKSQSVKPNGIISDYLDYRARDLARVVCFAMDRAKAKGAPCQFKGMSLGKISEALGVVNRAPHTAYGDACATAECYAKLVSM